jgi:hypothetical protein
VAYVVDDSWNFFWFSATDSRHSINISENPKVAGAIFDSTASSDLADGVQIIGIARPLMESEVLFIYELYWTSSFPDLAVRRRWQRPMSDFIGSALQKFYRLAPVEIYKCDPQSVVDRRIKVEL